MFLTAFCWHIHFPFDKGDNFGAVHIVFNLIMIVIIIFGFVLSCAYIFGENEKCTEPFIIPIKWKYIITILILIILYTSFASPIKTMKEMYNRNIEYKNQYDKVSYERKSFFDKMWKTYLQKNNICELNKNAFIQVTQIIMDGRHDGESVAWKWVQENQNIPYSQFTTMYFDLSTFVHEQRESYYRLEVQAMDIVRNNNTMLDTFPNNVYNKFLNIEHMQFEQGFTSTYTEEVFNSKIEDEVY